MRLITTTCLCLMALMASAQQPAANKYPYQNPNLSAHERAVDLCSRLTLEEKAKFIIRDIRAEKGNNPAVIFKRIAEKEYISIHGPEHHVLDGACILTAFYNAGGNIDLEQSLERLSKEGLRMPGAMCGLWGICGAIASVGAALAIIDGTGPLSADGSWGEHMSYTSRAISEMGRVNGPRCCKRDAMIALKNAVEYINSHYDVRLDYEEQTCEFSYKNEQCIRDRCPFFSKNI